MNFEPTHKIVGANVKVLVSLHEADCEEIGGTDLLFTKEEWNACDDASWTVNDDVLYFNGEPQTQCTLTALNDSSVMRANKTIPQENLDRIQSKKDALNRTLIRWQSGGVNLTMDEAEELFFRARSLSAVLQTSRPSTSEEAVELELIGYDEESAESGAEWDALGGDFHADLVAALEKFRR